MIILVLDILKIALPVLYILTTINYGLYFLRAKQAFEKTLTPLLTVSILLHVLFTVLISLNYRHFPITTVYDLLSFLALALALTYFYIEHRIGIKSTGVFVLIVVSICQTLSSLHRTKTSVISPILRSVYVGIHSMAAVFGYSAFIIATLYGLMYLMLFRTLKSRYFGLMYSRLPSLEELDEMNYGAAAIGLTFMTISITFGGIWLSKTIGDTSIFDPKIVGAFLTWGVFGANVVLKRFFRRSGLLTSCISFFGFAGIIFSMVIVNVFLTTFHLFAE